MTEAQQEELEIYLIQTKCFDGDLTNAALDWEMSRKIKAPNKNAIIAKVNRSYEETKSKLHFSTSKFFICIEAQMAVVVVGILAGLMI